MSWQTEWQACKKILCIRPDNLGDVIMMTPVFRALKESLPEVRITLLTSSVGKPIVPFIPQIDDSIMYDAPWIENERIRADTGAVGQTIDAIRERQFDGALLLTNYSQNPLPLAFLAYMADIPRILGYCRELPSDLINYWVPDTEPFTFPVHGVNRQLALLEKIGVTPREETLRLQLPESAVVEVEKKLAAIGITPDAAYIVLHPGVSLKRRQYPPEQFVKAAKLIHETCGYPILLTGSGSEQELAAQMAEAIGEGAYSLVNRLSVGELIAVITRAKLLISNNTAPVHIAAAVGTPVVDLYARSNPEHTPWMVGSRVLYFDIPPAERTQNTTLLYTTPAGEHPMPEPHHILTAVLELLAGKETTALPPEITTWTGEMESEAVLGNLSAGRIPV